MGFAHSTQHGGNLSRAATAQRPLSPSCRRRQRGRWRSPHMPREGGYGALLPPQGVIAWGPLARDELHPARQLLPAVLLVACSAISSPPIRSGASLLLVMCAILGGGPGRSWPWGPCQSAPACVGASYAHPSDDGQYLCALPLLP